MSQRRETNKLCIVYCALSLALIASCSSDPGLQASRKGEYETAVQEWRLLAEKGDAESQTRLGDSYYYGRGVPRNSEESVRWYLMAAEQDHARAQARLCSVYGDRGSRVQKNHKQAAKWCRKAAEQGSAWSQYRLGRLYLKGEGISKDLVAAYMFLSIALENGYSGADRELRSAVSQMTPEQVGEAKRMARQWMVKHPSARQVQLVAGLTFLSILLIGVRIRHGSILRPLRERLLYRVILASVAGWLSAWVVLPLSWGVPEDTAGFFVPGTLFGLSVMVPMLDSPANRPLRAATMVWAATTAHAAMWVSGILLVVGDYVFEYLVFIVPGLVFGAFVSVALSRTLNLRFGRAGWLSIAIICAACGFIHVFVVLGYSDSLGYFEHLTFDDSPMYLAYFLWFPALAAILNLGQLQPAAQRTKTDLALLIGLALVTLVVWKIVTTS